MYDDVLRETVSSALNIQLPDDRWCQASLPVRWGGLGICGACLLAPSAYLASAASTKELTLSLLATLLHGTIDSGISTAIDAWLSAAATSSPLSPVSLPSSAIQRTWDNQCCQAQADKLSNNNTDVVERARLLAARAPGSGDWLEALPLTSVGLKMDNNTVRIAVGLRLGAPIVHPHQCVCGSLVTRDGRHGLSCRKSAGRHSRHNQVNDILHRAFVSCGTLATREPRGLIVSGNKRPDGATLVPWRRGRCLAWDATCPDTFAASHLQANSSSAGSAAATAESRKALKYAAIQPTTDFVPFAVETSGVWGEQAFDLVKELGRRIATASHDSRSTVFLRQRISMAVQRGNACCVLGTVPMEQSVDEQ